MKALFEFSTYTANLFLNLEWFEKSTLLFRVMFSRKDQLIYYATISTKSSESLTIFFLQCWRVLQFFCSRQSLKTILSDFCYELVSYNFQNYIAKFCLFPSKPYIYLVIAFAVLIFSDFFKYMPTKFIQCAEVLFAGPVYYF